MSAARTSPGPGPSSPIAERRRLSWRSRIGAFALGTLAAGGVLEALVLGVYGEQPKFPRHVVEAPWGLRFNKPGARYRHKSADISVWMQVNGQGMRADRDFAYEKPPGTLRILSLGDSFTFGYEVEHEATFSAVLERELLAAGLDVEVLNAGISGASTAEMCLYLERELIRYDPDLVLLSFFTNDLVDNVRTGLFGLEAGALVELAHGYVPAGRLGNFLNRNWLAGKLAERSNAFVFFKERATLAIKRALVRRNRELMENKEQAASSDAAQESAAGEPAQSSADEEAFEERLCAAIVERMYAVLHERGVPFVIQGIPAQQQGFDDRPLYDLFPLDYVDFDRPGLDYFSAKEVLDPLVGEVPLYYQRSHHHWTPRSHETAGVNLARMIRERGLLSPSTARRGGDAGR